MAFWQYGLHGDYEFPASGGINKPYPTMDNLTGARIIGSITINPNAEGSYFINLNTFSLGTQIMLEGANVSYQFTVRTPPPVHQVQGMRGQFRAYLRTPAGGEIELGTFTSENIFGYLTDISAVFSAFSIYYQNYQTSDIFPIPPAKAFPKAGSGGGLTNSIAMLVEEGVGIKFYAVGYSSYYEINDVRYHYDAPAQYLFTLGEDLLNNPALFDPVEDAYTPDEGIDEGPGDGIPPLPTTPDYPGEDDDFPPLPTGANAFAFSKLKLFKPTAAQLGNALDILYTDSTDSTIEQIIESAKKWWYKPEQYCIALMLSPVNAATTTSEHIKFGKYDSGIFADVVADQWQKVNLGSCNIPLKFGSFLDFNPHTKAKVYLPFVGFRDVSITEIMGATLYCEYNIDMLTGSAVAFLKIKKEASNTIVSYAFECNLGFQVPLTSNNYSTVITTLISAGISAGMKNYGAAASQVSGAISGIGSPELTESGKLTANSGVLASFTPAVIIEFPVPSTPSGYSGYRGIPSDVVATLGSVHGYTVVSHIHLDIPDATDEEINEIETLLSQGVIL